MNRVVSVLFVFSFIFLITVAPASAANDWCIEDEDSPPCRGLPGKCTRNSDGSVGGFVANTARVEKAWGRNKPYIS